MKNLLAVTISMIAFPALAQSPEALAQFEWDKCIREAAGRYAKLPDPLADIATAAMSACQSKATDFDFALDRSKSPEVRQMMVDGTKEKMRANAMRYAADART